MSDTTPPRPSRESAERQPLRKGAEEAASTEPRAMHLRPNAVIKQVIVACCASLGYLTIGLVRGFSSPAVPSMAIYSPALVPDHNAISWISAVPPLGAFLGSLVAGPLMQTLGRKGSLLVGSPLFAMSWVAISFSPTPNAMIASRAATGFCVGLILPSAQVYVSECSHPKIRGRLGSMPAMFMAAGILVAYLLGYFLAWDKLALVSAVFPSFLFLFLVPLPESPAWLRSKGRDQDADEALEWLQLHPVKPNQLELNGKPQQQNQGKLLRPRVVLKGPYSPDEFLKKSVILPFGLVVAILVFQQISGIDTIIFYTVSIFQASGSTMGEYEATIVIGLVQLLSTIFSVFLIDRFGRRPLLQSSGIIMFLSMVGLGWYFYLHDRDMAEGLGLVPLISQMAFMAGFSIGYCNVPFLLMGELLPAAQRSFLSSIAGAINLGSMFLVIKTYPDTVSLIGSEGTFWLYALFCLASCFFVGFLLPETKGKSLEEIEAIFKAKDKEVES